MVIGIQKIYFEWEPALSNKWHKSMQGLCAKIRKKYHALTRRSTPEEGYVLIVLLSDHEEHLEQTMDQIIETCQLHGVGRIESESRSFPSVENQEEEE